MGTATTRTLPSLIPTNGDSTGLSLNLTLRNSLFGIIVHNFNLAVARVVGRKQIAHKERKRIGMMMTGFGSIVLTFVAHGSVHSLCVLNCGCG